MLYFVSTRSHRSVMDVFLAGYGRSLLGRMHPVSYEELFARRRVAPGSYIFADLERLSASDLGRAGAIWTALEASGRCPHLLNDPRRVMRRYELLRTLHDEGVNDFDVIRLTEHRSPARWPVFVRGENDHDGALTPLLDTQAELDTAVQALLRAGHARDALLVTEYAAAADASGIFQKYAAFYVRGQVIPAHILWSPRWCLKFDDIVNDDTLAEELRYQHENPRAEAVRSVFQRARIDYGRIDYGLLGGRIQVFEINTHPTVSTYLDVDHCRGKAIADRRTGIRDILYPRMVAHFEALMLPPGSHEPITLPRFRRPRIGLRNEAVWGALLRPLGLSARLPLVLARKAMRSARRRARH